MLDFCQRQVTIRIDIKQNFVRKQKKMGYTIAVSTVKGGVGKTTTVSSLAGIFAAQGYRVLALDLDPQSNLTIGLGINPDKLDKTLVESLAKEDVPLSSVIITLGEKFDLVPAHMALHALEMQMISSFAREKRLAHKLKAVRDNYDIILLDCAPSVNMLTINALSAADSVVVPVQANSFYALYGMTQLMTTIDFVQRDPNPALKVLGVVLTMSTNTRISKEVTAQIKETFGDKLFKTVVRLNTKLAEAPAMGQTIGLYAADSPAAEDYRQLAEEIKHRAKI